MKNAIHIPLILSASLFLALLLIVHLTLSFWIVVAQLMWFQSAASFLDECDQEIAAVYKSVIAFVDHKLEG